ncbi:hypothetical protein [Clostridium sp. YIM B02506]|uniref:hypothetical protein n=1 Tax=Clostridium sp. YIM B02506 TaxID=2910680 RepID=UPI001EEDC192|nr:hypothetical protein [Clostridium sp. YIM B02506]
MYNVTQTFLDKIKSYSRSFDSSITIRDVTFTEDDIISISLSEDVNSVDSFMLGSVASNVLEIEIMNVPESLILDGAKVTAKIGVNTGSTFEYVPLGVFWIDEIKKDSYSVKFTCVDNMIKLEKAYFSNLSYPASINSVAQEICTKVGIELATTLPSTQINKIEGYTYREAISFIASFLGGFARFNRLGKLEIVSYATTNIRVENQFSFTTNEKPFTIGKISCQVGENILTSGSSGNEIQLENPIMTQTQLNNIYNTLKTLNYMPYDMEYEGNPALMAGDKITIVGPDDVTYNTLLMRHKISYTGGLNATASAVGKTEQGQEFSSGGSLKNSVSRMVIEQANIKILLAEKATIEDLTATNAFIENLYATKATIQDLTAANARIDNLVTTKATVADLTAAVARIGVLEAGSATVTQLNAANAKISTLETRAASIDTLLAGNLTADNMKANLITAGTTLIADGSIASAKIISLSADKINAGKINTNLVSIQSSSGNMLISDNTIKIKDSTRVRVQIGKDASSDYNMYVWDSSGNLMFDATGLKASGIKSKIIRDDMVSDTANINATKIEKESLVTRINGATTLLLASKVKLDTENQTLEVAFNSLKSTVTTTASTVTSQGTSISTIQGQIQARIWQQDIDTLEDSLDTRISSTETSITAMNNAINLKVSTSDFNTYKTSNDNAVASKASQSALNITNGNINSLTTRVSTAESSIAVLQSQISLKVEQSDIVTAIEEAIDEIDTKISTTKAEIKLTTDSIISTVSSVQSSVTTLGNRVTSAESSISSLNNSITLKVNTSDFNSYKTTNDSTLSILTSRISSAELKITDSAIVATVRTSTAYTNDLSAKANQSALNTTNSTVAQLSSEISSRVKSSDFETYKTQTATLISSKVNTGDFGTLITQNVSSVKFAVGQIGGTNYIKDSSFEFGSIIMGSINGATISREGTNGTYPYIKDGYYRYKAITTINKDAGLYTDVSNLIVGSKYTFSAWVRPGAASLNIKLKIYTTGWAIVNMTDNTAPTVGSWYRFSCTFTASETTQRLCVVSYNPYEATFFTDCWQLIDGENVTEWSPNPNETSNISVDISDSGLTVRNGAISILNNAGTQVLKGDTSGNLTIRGDFTTYDDTTGNMAMRLSKRTMYFHDYDSNNVCGEVFAGKVVGSVTTRGMVFGAYRNKFLYLACQDTNNNMSPVITVDNGAFGSAGTVTITGGKQINTQNLYVSGSKNCIQRTQNYGDRLLYAYETTENYFGDLGFGKINEDGECIVSTDEIFGECVNTNIEYHVFTQIYQGAIAKIERYPNYFIVKGEIGTEFSWELKAKRAGFEHVRLEQKFVEEHGVESIEDELKQVISTDIAEELYEDLTDELLEV